jgi:hypothetical protein
MIKKFLPILLIFGVVMVFFWQFFLKGFLPIPSDTIVGLYYPFRDAYFKTNPNGLPYKNFLITDPVRQQIPWKELTINIEKSTNLPLWNPYNFAGTPLLANFQSGSFYPLNILFFILPIALSWSFFIILEPLLAGLFLYFYLNNLRLKKFASSLGALAFAFSGFFIAWLEWGNILHTALWLPLIMLSIDKIFSNPKSQIPNLKKICWCLVFVFSFTSSFFAGHLQTFFYVASLSLVYFIARWFQNGRKIKILGLFVILGLLFLILILPQLVPTLKFIALSARNLDLPDYRTNLGWFIPWQNLIQFIAPDFFGNPATLNYYGIWNYGEFIGYIGLAPLIFSFFALFFRRDRKTFFFGSLFFVTLIFALPTIFAKIPFRFEIPFLSTAQPTRLIFLTDFSLSILAALGIDYFIKAKNKKYILFVLGAIGLLFCGLWSFVLFLHGNIITADNLLVAKQNILLPTILFIIIAIILIFSLFVFNKQDKRSAFLINLILCLLIFITIFDLLRFGLKFEPFTDRRYLFPSTKVTSFLQNQTGLFRVLSTDSKILPPNFSIAYGIYTLDGYDPLYLQRYGELMAASGREKPDISAPFGFNRIITPHNYLSKIVDLMNVKYILSFDEIKSPRIKQVYTDGIIRVYENFDFFNRAFFVDTTVLVTNKQEAINAMLDESYLLSKRAVVEGVLDKKLFNSSWDLGKIDVKLYSANKIILETKTNKPGFLVLTDSYYPGWHAKIDRKETTIYLTDYNFRGIIVPKGNHSVEFYMTLN